MVGNTDKWSDVFQEALAEGDKGTLRKCPKSDLHNHAFAGGCGQFVKQKTGRDIQPLQAPLCSMDEMHGWIAENFDNVFDGANGRLLAFEAR
jgi:hypothetical protein